MKMTSVKSSQIAAHGYNPATKTLAVNFNGGGNYHYHDVSPEAYELLCKAESVGSHFHKHIKLGDFKFTKMEKKSDHK